MVKPDQPNGYKFETLVLDMVHMMDDCIPYEVVREREFAPIKNLHGVDSSGHCKRIVERLWHHIIIPLPKRLLCRKKAKKNMKQRIKRASAGDSGRRPFCAKAQRKTKEFRKSNRKRRKMTKI